MKPLKINQKNIQNNNEILLKYIDKLELNDNFNDKELIKIRNM